MAFEDLSSRLQDTFSGLRKKGKVTADDVNEALRDVRLALLEADVNFKVVRQFINEVKEEALGEEVIGSLTGGQQVIKIVNDKLTDMMGGEHQDLVFNEGPEPTVYMMIGLQGSGKTTTTGKLANLLRKEKNVDPLLVAADVYRPAAIDQLQTVGRELDIPVFSMGDQVSPVEIAQEGVEEGIRQGKDLVIIDTAGRIQIDEALMNELKEIKEATQPDEVFLVVDAMIGQEVANIAQSFNDQVGITSVLLTKLDGDTRGGAALSVSAVTGLPIKYVGTGEKLSDIQAFHPDRMANRILGMGDILTLIERAEQEVSEEEAAELARKMAENTYDFNDFIQNLEQMQGLGNMEDIIKMIPGMSQLPGLDDFEVDPKEIEWTKAMVYSMTEEERTNPDMISQNRRKRIAQGSGRSLQEVNQMISQFKQSKDLMNRMSTGNMKMPKGLGGGGNPLKKLFGRGKQQMPDMSQFGDIDLDQLSQLQGKTSLQEDKGTDLDKFFKARKKKKRKKKK